MEQPPSCKSDDQEDHHPDQCNIIPQSPALVVSDMIARVEGIKDVPSGTREARLRIPLDKLQGDGFDRLTAETDSFRGVTSIIFERCDGNVSLLAGLLEKLSRLENCELRETIFEQNTSYPDSLSFLCSLQERFPALEALTVSTGEFVPEDQLRLLLKMTSLKRLKLYVAYDDDDHNSSYLDEGDETLDHVRKVVQIVSDMDWLKSLSLPCDFIGPSEGIGSLSRLHNLVKLDLSWNYLESRHLSHLSSLVNMRDLRISDNIIERDWARHLTSMIGLQRLKVNDNSSMDVREVAVLPSLEYLDISHCYGIYRDDRGTLEALAKLIRLKHLRIRGHHIRMSSLLSCFPGRSVEIEG